jgi:hypothetical protein
MELQAWKPVMAPRLDKVQSLEYQALLDTMRHTP